MRVRIVRPSNPEFRRVKRGVLEATDAAYAPESRLGKAAVLFKRALLGVPIATARADQERLTKFKALAVLSSDAISSVAYATEAILINLVAGGSQHLGGSARPSIRRPSLRRGSRKARAGPFGRGGSCRSPAA
jgi:hypothetical protein